jgi:hypothetical protein
MAPSWIANALMPGRSRVYVAASVPTAVANCCTGTGNAVDFIAGEPGRKL